MPLGADHDVQRLALGQPKEVGERAWVEVEVRVHIGDEPPGGLERAGLHCVPLPEVAVVMDHARDRISALQHALLAAVARAVGDDDQLDRLAERALDPLPDRAHVVRDRSGEVVDGDDDAEERPGGLGGGRNDLRAQGGL